MQATTNAGGSGMLVGVLFHQSFGDVGALIDEKHSAAVQALKSVSTLTDLHASMSHEHSTRTRFT